MGNAVWKILGTGSAIVAGMAANKVITKLWEKSGRDANLDPNNPDSPLGEAIVFAAIVGLGMGLARTLATRKAAQFYQRSSGHLPTELTTRDDA